MAGRMMKDSGVEWIGTIPNEWKVKRNKELFTEVNERCEKGDDYTLLSVSEYSGVTPRTDVIKDGEFETHAESLDGYKICRAGNIVMNIMLAWKRATAVSRYDGIVSPAYCVYKGNRDVDTRYFHYLFRTDICADMFKQYSTGIIDSRLRLYPDKFLTLYSAVPPLQEQARIADFLDKKVSEIDAVISKTKESIEEYKKLKQSIIAEAVTKGLDPNVEMKDSGVEWIGNTPVNWSKNKIIRCFDVIGSGTTPKATENDNFEGSINWIQSGDINGGQIIECKNKINENVLKRYSTLKIYKEPFIIVAMYGASIGNVSISKIDGCVNQACCVLSEPHLNFEYVFYCLKSAKDFFIYKGIGGGQPNISQEEVKQLWIPIPPETEQCQIVAFLDSQCSSFDNLISKKEQVITELEQYKKSLIYEYVTGKKEVA